MDENLLFTSNLSVSIETRRGNFNNRSIGQLNRGFVSRCLHRLNY